MDYSNKGMKFTVSRFNLWVIFPMLCSVFLASGASGAVEIPEYSPNVVDPNAYISLAEREEINRLIDGIQSRGAFRPAVYLLPTLGEESIEGLAERAFRTWELGEKGKDNGLLLVIAMEDRKMRIETGYGIEASITDLAARRVLDEVLKPHLREGRLHAGVLAALQSLESIQTKGLEAGLGEAQSGGLMSDARISSDFTLENVRRGLAWWGGHVFLIFLAHPFFVFITGRKKQRLLLEAPDLAGKLIVKPEEKSFLSALLKGWPIRLFLALNPGLFIFVFATIGLISPIFDYIVLFLIPIILIWLYRRIVWRYGSVKLVKGFLAAEALAQEQRMKRLVEFGHATLGEDGTYKYTEAYHESERKRIAASSRSGSSGSGSSRSSSSGGGRSGGGGASSSW
jgi:uncharacterized protein